MDGNTYEMGTDFLYTEGLVKITYFGPVFDDPDLGMLFPSEYRADNMRVYWTYDFSAIPGGIDGTIRMQLIANHEIGVVNSLAGTSKENARGSTKENLASKLKFNLFIEGI